MLDPEFPELTEPRSTKGGGDTYFPDAVQGSAPHTEGVPTHSGGPVTGILPNGNPRVTREEHPAPKQTEVAHRNRIPCQECDGHGVYSIANSLDPYAKLYECETCEGTGFEAEELDPDRLREDRDEREMLRKEWA